MENNQDSMDLVTGNGSHKEHNPVPKITQIIPGFVVRSNVMRQLCRFIQKVAPANATILIYGETGTGKELVAKAIHQGSNRKNNPLVVIDCTTLHENTIESELFGHVKGAYTGAGSDRVGLFESANHGTVFFDEISELPLDQQSKLLRVLESHEVRLMGTNTPIKIDIRVLASTNRDLRDMVRKKQFREDLYYRLNCLTCRIPPLEKRPKDISAIAQYYWDKYCGNGAILPEGILERLEKHTWRGNVRELKQVIEAMSVFKDDSATQLFILGQLLNGENTNVSFELKPLSEVERTHILGVLSECKGNKAEAARILGVHIRTIRNKLHGWGVNGDFAN